MDSRQRRCRQGSWLRRCAGTSAVAFALLLGGRAAVGGDLEPAASPITTAPLLQLAEGESAGEAGLGGFLSEVRVGVLDHDTGLTGERIEDGFDVNAELLFVSIDILDFIPSPRPHIGVSIHSEGNTSQLYGGFTWDWTFWEPYFIEGTLGLAVHDGRTDMNTDDEKAVGCRLLIRESLSLGARFRDHHSVSLMLAHVSSAGFCDANKGLETFGIRYGFRF